MAEPTIQLGGGNWAGKTDNLLGYYKEGERFYKQDFTFSRSTTGTYTDSDGYIQEMPYNLIRQSNTFDTTWINSNTTETSGQTGYDNSNNAWLLEKSASNGYIKNDYPFDGSNYTFSTYLKTGSTNWGAIFMGGRVAFFNLDNGTKGTQNGISSSIESVGNGWYRCSIVFNYNGSSSVRIYPANGDDDLTGTSGSIFIQNAQLNKGTSAKTYFPTTTRLNMPRVDYLNNSNGSLILEPQRTNLITQSESFESYWIKTNITASDNEIISPDGTQNACLLTDNSTDGYHNINRIDITPTDSNNYTRSFYVKKGTARYVVISARQISNSSSTSWIYDFDDNDWSVTASSGEGQTIEVLSNGWIRLSVTIISSSNLNNDVSIGISSGSTMADTSYIGSGDTLYIWGGQIEQGSYPTTLINTSGSSVTRNADACSITNVADRIGQTEGTLYGEFDFKDHSTGTRRLLCLTDGTSTNRITTYVNGLDKLSVYIVDGGAAQADIQATILTEGTIKYAVAYANNSIKLYLNGTQVGTDTSATIPSTSDLYIGTENNSLPSNFNWRNCKLYNTALTDSELATLTTL